MRSGAGSRGRAAGAGSQGDAANRAEAEGGNLARATTPSPRGPRRAGAASVCRRSPPPAGSPSVDSGGLQLVVNRQIPDALTGRREIALHNAGAIGGTPGSPTPPSGSSKFPGTMCTRISRGAAAIRRTS